jgi:hypothetical protein
MTRYIRSFHESMTADHAFVQFGFNDDALWFATAAFYAFRAYNDTNLLNHAIDTWKHVSTL